MMYNTVFTQIQGDPEYKVTPPPVIRFYMWKNYYFVIISQI